MAYKLTRSTRIIETLELTDENDNVVDTIDIDLDADAICTAFRKKHLAIIDAERRLKEVQKKGVQENIETAFSVYGTALLDVFELVFGTSGTKKILEFYENKYVEMSVQIVPFIYSVIVPKINETLNNQKTKLKNMYRHHK